MVVLFTDTDTDLTPEEAKMYNYHLISMPYIVNDKEIYPYEDFDVFDYQAFYNMLREGIIPKTCAISPLKYFNYFEPYLKEGYDILYVHFSKAMSGTFNAMNLAIEELNKKYPQRTIYTIDTKGITILSLMIVKEIGELFKQGKSIEEVIAWSNTEIDKWAVYFYAEDLKFFQKSGRVSGFTATMGSMLGIHPIIFMDSEGQMRNISKEHGKMRALRRLVKYVEELGDDVINHRIIIGHSDAEDNAILLCNLLKEKFGSNLQVEFVVVNPTAGSHCGPSSVGICFHAIHR